MQITGNFGAVKKAVLSVSACFYDNNSGAFKPLDHHSRGCYSESAGHSSHRMFLEEDVVFKLLCHHEKVGSLIGKGGSVVRALQNETGASIQIVEAGPDSDERVVVISAREACQQLLFCL